MGTDGEAIFEQPQESATARVDPPHRKVEGRDERTSQEAVARERRQRRRQARRLGMKVPSTPSQVRSSKFPVRRKWSARVGEQPASPRAPRSSHRRTWRAAEVNGHGATTPANGPEESAEPHTRLPCSGTERGDTGPHHESGADPNCFPLGGQPLGALEGIHPWPDPGRHPHPSARRSKGTTAEFDPACAKARQGRARRSVFLAQRTAREGDATRGGSARTR